MKPSTYVNKTVVDLYVGFLYLGLSAGVLLVSNVAPAVRAAVGLPLLVFLSGYSLLAALFPAQLTRHATGLQASSARANRDGNIDLTERIALSFGASIALIPLIGLALAGLGFTLSPVPIVSALVTVSAAGLIVGLIRRARLPHEKRFQLPLERWNNRAKVAIDSRPALDVVLNVALALTIVLAVGTFGYGLLTTSVAETDSSMALLADGENGSLAADEYPTDVSPGESASFTAAVHNGERKRVEYTLVVQLQRVDVAGDSVEVQESQEVTRLREAVSPDRTWHANHTVEPELTGRNLRLTYYLYRDAPPEEPTTESAYRNAYVWMNVTGT